ncbi:MAG: SAM-dependent methyltransferase [Acidobacteriota bacterium]
MRSEASTMVGKVYLVGAGPGDPGLITVKGRDMLSRADAVFYDNLANDRLLDYAKPSAVRIYVGKKRADHEMSQEAINNLMIEHARAGRVADRGRVAQRHEDGCGYSNGGGQPDPGG